MRRSARLVLGFARQAACGGPQSAEGKAWLTPACSGSAALLPLQDTAGSGGGTRLPALRPADTRHFSASTRLQHNAQPAAAEQQQQEQQPPQQQAARERTCWQCGTRLVSSNLFFCPECESVLPASADPQYYQVFDLGEQRFDVDVPDLERRYKALQRRLHPDKFSTASSLEQEYAHQQARQRPPALAPSGELRGFRRHARVVPRRLLPWPLPLPSTLQAAVVNQAYDVLKAPLRRAHYILSQAGLGACEGMTITDPELLMYVMEAREDVEGASEPGQLQALLEQNTAVKDKCIQELAAAFGSGDLRHAAELTTQLRYICRIREAIVDKL